ncbi:MAG: amino acid ABC transporter permease [Anaerolineaceae bacterium]
MTRISLSQTRPSLKERLRDLPWWIIAIFAIAVLVFILITTNSDYQEAFIFIKAGLVVTLSTTFFAFLIALTLGLITGLGRISENIFFKNLATFYVEVVRGIPMLVLIFFIALVGVPAAVNGIHALGAWLSTSGLAGLSVVFSGAKNNSVPMNIRAIIALSITYGAFLAEIFRAGIQSIDKGQMEAARSQGMTKWQAMWFIILPQAIRNVLPALGNDFISMLKDSSLVSILAVRDITQIARLYAGNTFKYQTTYITLAVMYLTMTIALSFLVKFFERRFQIDGKR